jgi:hypothetical protein
MANHQHLLKYLNAVRDSCSQIKYLNAGDFFEVYSKMLRVLNEAEFIDNKTMIQEKIEKLPLVTLADLQLFESRDRDKLDWDNIEESKNFLEALFPSLVSRSTPDKLIDIKTLTSKIIFLLEHPGMEDMINDAK